VIRKDPHKGEVLCTANLGYRHREPADAERTVVCMSGFFRPE